MPLTPDQTQKAMSWIKAKLKACHNCGSNTLMIGEIVRGDVFSATTLSVGGPCVPMLEVTCSSCSYIHLFAAVPIGLVN